MLELRNEPGLTFGNCLGSRPHFSMVKTHLLVYRIGANMRQISRAACVAAALLLSAVCVQAQDTTQAVIRPPTVPLFAPLPGTPPAQPVAQPSVPPHPHPIPLPPPGQLPVNP